jgi:glycosyltransferase involved in cell wall biosynthesis
VERTVATSFAANIHADYVSWALRGGLARTAGHRRFTMIDPRAPDYSNDPVSVARPRFGYAPAVSYGPPAATIITTFSATDADLDDTARSIFQQSLQQWEWIVVADATGAAQAHRILGQYDDSYSRLRIIELEAPVVRAAARNVGFSAARSGCLLHLRSGDLLEPTALEKWVWLLESYPDAGIVDSFAVHACDDKHLSPRGLHDDSGLLQTSLAQVSFAIRSSMHAAVGGYDESLPDDMIDCDYLHRCATLGTWAETLPEYLFWSRTTDKHQLQWSGLGNPDVCKCDTHQQLREHWDTLQEAVKSQTPSSAKRKPAMFDLSQSWKNYLAKQGPRLLLVVSQLTVGGSEKVSLDLVEQLTSRGWEITIATTLTADNVWLPQFARLTPDIFVLANFLQPSDYPRYISYLILSRQIDCVLICSSELGYRLLPYFRSKHPGVTLADICHVETEYWRDGGYARMSVEYQDLIDLTITSTDHLKRWMICNGAGAERIEVAHTNVDCDIWSPNLIVRELVRSELGLGADLPVVLFVGRVCPDKQPHILAHTALRLHEAGVDFVLLVAGTGPDKPWLETFVAEHDLGDVVRVLGAVPFGRVEQLMQASDVFFLPSRWEGIAVTLFEALASGVVPVAADVGGQRELVTADCGILVSGDEVTQERRYAGALIRLACDPNLRRAMSSAGRRRVQTHFRLVDMGSRVEYLLRHSIEAHVSPMHEGISAGLGEALARQAIDNVELQQAGERLEAARAWSDQQRRLWERASREQDASVSHLRSWIDELKQALAWCEEQRRAWQEAAEAFERLTHQGSHSTLDFGGSQRSYVAHLKGQLRMLCTGLALLRGVRRLLPPRERA